jgi:hypothetical protein
MNVATGAELRFTGNYTHAGSSHLNGPGLLHFANGTQAVPSGTANIDAPLLFDGTTASIMGGSGTWQVNGTMTWTGTTIMNGAGKTVFPVGSTVTISPASANQVYLNNTRVVENSGTINWISGRIFLDTTADNNQFVNKPDGVMNLNGAEGFGNQLGGRTFVNQGTVNKLGTGTFTMSVQNTNLLSNTGTINVKAGVFQRELRRHEFVDHDGGSRCGAAVFRKLYSCGRHPAQRFAEARDGPGPLRQRYSGSTPRSDCDRQRAAPIRRHHRLDHGRRGDVARERNDDLGWDYRDERRGQDGLPRNIARHDYRAHEQPGLSQ